jgi:hypothetical protein
MNIELLKTEFERAVQAELESDEQLRNLPDLIDKASSPGGSINATDCAKLVSAALSLNERLRDRAGTLGREVKNFDSNKQAEARIRQIMAEGPYAK